MKEIITISVKETYGTKRVYLIDPDFEWVLRLTMTRTLTLRHVEILKEAGFKFKVICGGEL